MNLFGSSNFQNTDSDQAVTKDGLFVIVCPVSFISPLVSTKCLVNPCVFFPPPQKKGKGKKISSYSYLFGTQSNYYE